MLIVSAADENFTQHFATMLRSTWYHNPDAEFYLLDCGITTETLDLIERFASINAIRLTVVAVDTAPFEGLDTPNYLSAAAYARLLIPNILSGAIDKALYIDADCVVTGDLTPLWATPLSDRLLAGAEDNDAMADEPPNDPIGNPYINSGVILFNLPIWRSEKATEKAIALVRTDTLRWHDQSALNRVAFGRIESIPSFWNFRASTVDGHRCPPIVPKIIHYTGPLKPWLYRDAPLGRVYQFHRRQTPFPLPDPLPPHRPRFYTIASLMAFRLKYWRRLIYWRYNEQRITKPYLDQMAEITRKD